MIRYKFEEEPKYAMYYARRLGDDRALSLIEAGEVGSSEDAFYLSDFFWRMVDASIADEKNEEELPWSEGAEFWNEKLMNSISGYLERAGYEREWDEVLDRQ